MPKYRVRYNVEFVLDVEAASEKDAEVIADTTDEEEFHRVVSGFETENVTEEEPAHV